MLKISQAHSPTLSKSQGNFNAVNLQANYLASRQRESFCGNERNLVLFRSISPACDDKSYKRSGPLKILTSNFAPKLTKFKEEPTQINCSIFARRTRFLNLWRPQEALRLAKSRRR